MKKRKEQILHNILQHSLQNSLQDSLRYSLQFSLQYSQIMSMALVYLLSLSLVYFLHTTLFSLKIENICFKCFKKYTIKWVTMIVRKILKNLLMMDPP